MAAPMKFIRYSRILLTANTRKTGLHRVCQRQTGNVSESARKVWQLHSAVCLQRYPVISAEMDELEERCQDYLQQLEDEGSFLSDYEMQELEEKRQKEKIAKMSEEEKKKLDDKSLLTLDEIQDQRKKEVEAFQLADRLTDADKNSDMTTHQRQLDKKLVLIVKQKWNERSEPKWSFPQSCRQDGESMREAAERTLMTTCGESLDALFVGNAPCGYIKYKLPKSFDGPDHGVKTFFFKANHLNGEVERVGNVVDHKWVTFEELPDYFGKDYMHAVKSFFALNYV